MNAVWKAIRQFDLVDIISNLAPWLTPIPSAVLVSAATIRHLQWSEPVGWVSGLIVEMLGISTVATTMAFYAYNQEKRQKDPYLPTPVGIALVGVYLASTVILTVLLDTIPLLAHWSPIIFPILALVGAINLVLRRNYRITIRKIEAEREQMRMLREAAKAAREAKQPAAKQSELPSEAAPAPAKPKADLRFACSECIRSFKTPQALSAHMRIHRKQEPEQPELDL